MMLPTIASLWVGRPLSWIEKLSLSSFLAVGHKVKLYTYSDISGVPDGVELANAAEIFNPSPDIVKRAGPALVADVFRLHLMQKSDEVWVDVDMVATKPILLNKNGFAIGYETAGKSVCNAVLRTPRESQSIKFLVDFTENPHNNPPWLRSILRAKIVDTPSDQLLSSLFRVKRPSMGPIALTYALRNTGEIREARPRGAFYSVPWQYADVLFNPFGGADGWMSAETEAVHLWSHALKAYHKKRKPHPDSFVGTMQAKLGIDVSHLKPHVVL